MHSSFGYKPPLRGNPLSLNAAYNLAFFCLPSSGNLDFPNRPHSLNRREWSVQMERFLTGDEKVK